MIHAGKTKVKKECEAEGGGKERLGEGGEKTLLSLQSICAILSFHNSTFFSVCTTMYYLQVTVHLPYISLNKL